MANKTINKKIKILGAGISGMTAAIVLSRAGYRVDIYEKRKHVGSFFEKDIHSFRNYLYDYDVIEKYKQIGVGISNVYPIYKEFRYAPSLKKIEIHSDDKPLFYNYFRGCKDERSFDVELYKAAKKEGIGFHFNKNVKIDHVDIVATGARSANFLGYGEYYSGVTGIAPNSNYIFLNNRYSPNGYGYILPFNNEVVVILGSAKIESKSQLKKRFNLFKSENPIIKSAISGAKLENEIFGYLHYSLPTTAMKKGKLYVGECAGFLDSATMFGVHYAILSGYLAARSIIEDTNYDIEWKKVFGEELRHQFFKREKLQKLENEDYEKLIDDIIGSHGNKILSNEYRKLHSYSRK